MTREIEPHDPVASLALAAIDRIELAITEAETPMAALDGRDAAQNASIYARMAGLQGEGIRFQHLVLDAERKIVAITPKRQGQRNDFVPQGTKFPITGVQLRKWRRAYEQLEEGIRLQHLVLDAERKIVGITPRSPGQRNDLSPWGDRFPITRDQLRNWRRTYERLEEGIRLQHLVLDAERKIVEITPVSTGGAF